MNPIRVAIFAVSALTVTACDSHAASPSAWSIKTHVDQMTGKKTSYAVDAAKSPFTTYLGMKETVRLLLDCPRPGNEPEMMLSIGAVLNGDIVNNIHPANIRFDESKEFRWNLSALSNGNGYMFNDPVQLLKKGSKAKRMLLQFTTEPLGQQKIVDFDMSGTKAVLNKLQCHA